MHKLWQGLASENARAISSSKFSKESDSVVRMQVVVPKAVTSADVLFADVEITVVGANKL